MRIPRHSWALAAGLLLLWDSGGGIRAEPPPVGAESGAAAAASSNAAQGVVEKGDFFSSFKQAFSQNTDREVVRGHFDVGSPPNTHRFYCLVDPKTGKSEPNAVAGEPVLRRDGMTGLKGPAVSPLNCADAEQKGILVTSGYTVKGAMASTSSPALPVQRTPAAAAVPAAAGATVAAGATAAAGGPPAAGATTAAATTAAATTAAATTVAVTPAAGAPTGAGATVANPVQTEVMAVYTRFVAGLNAHDRAAVAELLLDSKDFVWAQSGGSSIWGSKEALEAFEQEWKGTWRMDPQPQGLRVAHLSPDVAVLITPLLITAGFPGEDPSTVPIRWGGVFVKTTSGWRISSIFITPFKGWRPSHSN